MRAKNNISSKGNNAVAVIVDGETEKWYLQLLNQEEDLRLPITYILPKGNLQELYEIVKEQCALPFTKVYWIVDFDVIMKEDRERANGTPSPVAKFREILKELDSKPKKYPNLCLYINNPCLEFFHILHFKDTSRYYPMYEPDLRKDLQRALPNYEKSEKYYKSGTNIYIRLKPNQDIALDRASKLPGFDIDDSQRAQAGIYEMVKELLPNNKRD
ncbi:MAG: RloB domain-containing protein [Prevotella sp.]|nr:RloB domain-containing protein [Prevotella sp.]